MRGSLRLAAVVLLACAGCPGSGSGGGGSGDGDNPVVNALHDYCKPKCQKFQQCNAALFALKFASLDACVQACDPFVIESTCDQRCDTQYATDATQHAQCIDTCGNDTSLADCNAECAYTIGTQAECKGACAAKFSQACATAHQGVYTCLLGLACTRATDLMDFGGSASMVGECQTQSDQINKSCF